MKQKHTIVVSCDGCGINGKTEVECEWDNIGKVMIEVNPQGWKTLPVPRTDGIVSGTFCPECLS